MRAFVPSTNYRGVGQAGTGSDWVHLSPSIKPVSENKAVDLRDAVAFDFNGYLSQLTTERPGEAYERQLRQYIHATGIECETLDSAMPNLRAVKTQHGILPSDLPVPRLASHGVSDALPSVVVDQTSFALTDEDGGLIFQYERPVQELWGKSVAVVYSPATAADAEILNQHGGIEGAPAYLVHVRPNLQVDGVTVATGSSVLLGEAQAMRITITQPGNDPSSVVHDITAGGVYAFSIDPGRVPADLIAERQARLSGLAGDGFIAEKLFITALTYQQELAAVRDRIAGLHWMRVFKDSEETMAAIEPRINRIGSLPLSISRDFFMLDAALVRSGQFSVDGDNHRRVQVARLVGFESSFLEHRVGEVFWGPRQFSSVKLLQQARVAAVPVVTFNQGNLVEGLEQVHWPQEFEDALAASANRGLVITVPVQGHNEPGLGTLFGYIGTDPTLGTGEYIVAFEAGVANAVVNGGVGDSGGGAGGGGSDPPPGCLTCGGQGAGNSSVHLYSGNYVHQETDLTLPARGIPLSFTRTYSAMLGWHHNYGQRVSANLDGSLTWVDETGVPRRFTQTGSGMWSPPATFFQTVEVDGAGYRMVFPDGMIYRFDGQGRLGSMTDLNNNQVRLYYNALSQLETVQGEGGSGLQLQYDGLGRLTTVSDTAGRSVVFTYVVGNLIASETDVISRVRTYEYDTNGRMIAKVDPRGNRAEMNYDDRGRVVRFVDQEGGVRTYAYDADNRRTLMTDRTGRATTLWELGEHARPIRTVDAIGNETLMTYDTRGNKLSEQDPRGKLSTMAYDSNGNLLHRTDPTGAETTFVYGAHARLLMTVDDAGNTTTNAYDARGNLTSTTDPEHNVTTYTYDASGLPQSITRPGGSTTSMSYDAAGNVRTMTDPEGGVTRLEYDGAGHLTAMVDPNSARREMIVDDAGQMASMRDPDGGITRFAYDPNGNRLSVTDPENHVTAFTYDRLNRLKTTTDALGNTTSQSYDPEGRVLVRVDARGFRTEMEYDRVGRLVKTRDAAGNESRMGYCADLAQQPCVSIDALGNVSRIEEDELGREARRIDPLGNVTETRYDELGRRDSVVDPAGNVTSFGYDDSGRLTMVTDALGGITGYGYDLRGNRTRVTDANGHTTAFEYDRANRLRFETTPISTNTEFRYDVAGNRTQKIDGKGQVTTFGYDPSRRLTEILYAAGVDPAHFGYDDRGNRTSEGNGDSNRTTAYDALGRVSAVTDAETGRTITYSYDANGNRASMRVMPDDETTSYSWDSRNLLTRMVDPEGGVYQFAYDALGRRERAVYPNGMTLQNFYDAGSRVTAMVYRDRAGTVIESFAYTYDSRGNRTSKIFADGKAEVYEYDALSRLTRVTYPGGRAVVYEYDAVGNRLRMQEGVATQALSGCPGDQDCDGKFDAVDNCPAVANASQVDSDWSGFPQGFSAGYRFEDGTNTFAIADETGRNDGRITEATHVEGRYGQAREFGGNVNLYAGGAGTTTVPSSPSLEDVQEGYTIATWIKPRYNSWLQRAGGGVVSKAGQFFWTLVLDGNGTYSQYTEGVSNTLYQVPVPIEVGQWQHAALVVSLTRVRIYLNGEMVVDRERQTQGFAVSDKQLVIGNLSLASGQVEYTPFTGNLDELVIYPRALTAEEVYAVMSGPIVFGDGQGDACDACPASTDRTCAPVTCRDDDGDGYGVQGASACGGGGRERQFDCADGDVSRHPGALEKCDSIDNDCDGRVDEACMQNVVTTRYIYNAFNQLVSSGRDVEGVCSANDTDCDGVVNAMDNCPLVYNADQRNSDGNAESPVALGAIAYYDFDTTVGNQFPDLAGSYPATMGAETQLVPGRPGGGQGIATDGTPNSAVTIPSAINTPLNAAAGQKFTVEGWMRVMEEFPQAGSFMGLRNDGTHYYPVGFVGQYENPYAPMRGFLEFSAATDWTTPVRTGVWTHVGATYDGTTRRTRLYVNGVEVATGLAGEPPIHPLKSAWTFGYADYAPGGFPRDGIASQFDDWAFYDKELTPAQMRMRGTLPDAAGDACDACPLDANGACLPTLCTDVDGDGFGVPGASACAGGVTRFDCNDADASVQPGVGEVDGDGVDNNCDGVVDGVYVAPGVGGGGVPVTRYAYEGNGNQTTKHEGGVLVSTYVWDARDRLVRVTDGGGGVLGEYGYDTQNLRVKTRDASGDRRILLDGIEELAEYDVTSGSAGARVARYDHDVTRVDALLAQVTGSGAAAVKVHPWVNALGSVYGLGDGSGTVAGVQARYAYDVYGAREQVGGGTSTKWGFTGRVHDVNAGGQTYLRDRLLQPDVGRFSSRDLHSFSELLSREPLGFAFLQFGNLDGSLYQYANNDPTLYLDPSGRNAALVLVLPFIPPHVIAVALVVIVLIVATIYLAMKIDEAFGRTGEVIEVPDRKRMPPAKPPRSCGDVLRLLMGYCDQKCSSAWTRLPCYSAAIFSYALCKLQGGGD